MTHKIHGLEQYGWYTVWQVTAVRLHYILLKRYFDYATYQWRTNQCKWQYRLSL